MELNKMFTASLLLLTLLNAVLSVPVLQWESSSCAKTCNSDPLLIRYDVGKTYFYQLDSSTRISYGSQQGLQSVSIKGTVELSTHSPCEMSLQLRDIELVGIENSNELFDMKQQLESQPLQFGYNDGSIVGVCPSNEDQLWAINVKKSVLSALQMSAKSTQQKSIVTETDILGNCETVYEPISRRYATIVIQKTKQLNECGNRQQTQIGLFPRKYGLNEVIRTSAPIMNSSYICSQTIDKDLVTISRCQEQQLFWPTSIQINSEIELNFIKQITGLSAKRVQQFSSQRHQLLMSSWSSKSNKNWDESEFISLLRSICSQIQNDVLLPETTQSFPELVEALKSVSLQSIDRIWNSVQNNEVCDSNKLKDLFLDASALATSEASVRILVQQLQNSAISNTRASYLFSLMAFTSNPSERALKQLLPLVERRETPRQVIVGISGLIHNLKVRDGQQQQSQTIRQVIDSIVSRLESARQQSEQISMLRALENIGVQSHDRAKQQLISLATNSRTNEGVRVVAIQVLLEASDDQIRQQLFQLFRTESESNELRIQAYKTIVMSGTNQRQLEQIRDQVRRDQNQNVVNYVRSHQKNLRQSSDPHKRDVLPSNAPQFNQPSNNWGQSRNLELSYLHESTQIGLSVESDLIYPKESQIPRSLTINTTVPLFGRELQVVEIQLRQQGLDSVIKQVLRENNGNFPKILNDLLELFTQENIIQSQDVVLQFNLKVDGKTIVFLDAKDIDLEFNQLLQNLRQQLQERLTIDRAFAFIPVNTRIQLPTSNGLPMSLRLNTTLVSGLKADLKLDTRQSSSSVLEANILPSVAVQFEAAVEFQANNQKKSIEFVSQLSSSPQFNILAQTRDGRIINAKINLPNQKQSLIRFDAKVYERDESGQRRTVKGQQQQHYQKCTQSLNKVLGISFCSEMSYSKPFLPFGPINAQLTLQKTDKSMKSFEFSAEVPPNNAEEMQVYKVSLNTPNSEIDRQISAELQVSNPQNGKKEVRIQLRSPWKRLSASAALRNEEKERAVQFEVHSDNQKLVSIDAGIESQTRGQKREYRPRVRIQLSPGSEPIALQGSVSMSKGRKNQLSINLEGNQKQLIKGSFVREGERKSNEFRVSSDLTLNLPGIEFRVSGVADKAQKHMMSDFNVEYKLQKQRKESFKLSAKLQNLTQSQLTKMSAFGELTSTQFPQFNFHLAYNLLKKPFEHVENELTVAWRQQLKDKIHLLQVSKYSSLEDNSNEQKLENTVVIEITPFDINYELRANGVMQRSGSVGPKYNVELIGKDRTGRKENDLKGSFEYRHISRSPLHLSMEANLKTLTREMSYKDELKETSPNQYNGKTSVQWQKDKKAQLDYNYKIKSDSGHTVHHEIDAELKTPNSPHPIRHTGLLRMTRNDLHLKSKVNYNGKQLYNYESLVSRVNPSKLNFDVNGVQTKVNLSPYSVPQLAGLEVSSDGYHHKSNVELVPRTSFALKSDTKRNARNLFALESHISNTEPSRIVINSDPFEGRVDYDTISNRKTGSIEIRSPTQKWSHVSQYNYDPSQQSVSLKSNTELNGQRLLNLDSQYAKKDRSFLNVELPETQLSFDANTYSRQKSGNLELKTRQISHKSSVQWNPNEVKLISNTLRNRQQLADLDYNYNNGLHSFNLETPEYSGQLEGQLNGQPFGKLGLKAKRTQYEHVSRFTTQPQKLIIESRTEKRGNNLMNLNALLSRSNNVESNIRIITPRVTTKLSATPYSSAKFEWNSPEIDHQTDYTFNNNQNNEYVLDSKTQLNGRQQSSYNFLAKHSPQKQTLVSVKIPAFNSQIHFENPSKVKFQFEGKQSQQYINPVNHLTEFEYNNPSRSYTLKSRTERAINGENILSFDGQYNHLNENSPSQINVNYGQQISSKLQINPFNRREKSVNFETKSPNYNHVTDIQLDSNANAFKLKSRTDNNFGQNLAKIDSYLTPQYGQKSHISIVTQNSNGNVEYEPQQRAKVEFRLNNQDLTHNSELVRNQNQYKLQSLTSRNGQNLLDLNSLLNTDYDSVSHLNINSPQLNSKLTVNPQQKNVKFEVRTDSVNHLTNFKLNPSQRSVQLQSNTDYQNRLLAHLNTNLNADNNNQIDFEIPAFESKSNLNLLTKKASIDFRSKLRNGRHVLASVALNPDSKNGFHSDISWDADKDPNQRLIIDLSARREGSPSLFGSSNNQQLVFSAEANYAQNQFKVLTKMNPQNLISGPHSLNIDYIPKENPKRDSISLKGEHVIVNNEFQCKWNYLESNQIKYGVKLNAKANQDGHGYSATLETNAPKNPELEYKVEFNQRQAHNQWFTELKANQGMSQHYKASLDLKQDSRDQYKGILSLDTPTIQGQSVNFLLEKSEKKLSLNAINQNGKQLEVKSGLTENGAQFDMKSNLDQIPSIRANLNYVPYTEVELNVVQDAENIVDFQVKLSGDSIQSGFGLNGRLESKYTPNVEMNAKARKDSSDVQLEAKLKYNEREIFATEVNAQKRSNSWTGEGVVSGHGAELARASLESSFGSNSLQYLLKANGKQFSPVNVKFNTQSNGDEKKGSIKMCSNENCMDFGLEYKLRKYSSYIPEKLNLRLQKLGTDVQVQYSIFERVSGFDKYENSVLQLSRDEKVQQKFRNQVMVTINSHTIGFDMLNSQRDNNNAFDSILKIYFPSNRSIQLRTDYKRSSESRNEEKHQLKVDFKPDSRDTQPLFTSYLVFNSNDNEISSKFELNSEKFRRNPKTISFESQKNNRLNAKVSVDVTNNPNNALNIESRFTEGQNNNRTLQLSIATRDRRSIDFSTQMHLSPSSAGVLWQNLNRNGQKTQGFYFFQYLGNRRFEAIVRDSQNQYRINGNYNKNENSGEVAIDLSILNEQSNIERNVRLSMDKQCAKYEAKRDGKQEKRTSFCINTENSKLFAISAESVENSEKLMDLNLELQDVRSSKVMRVHMNWNPKQLEKVLADFIENYDQNNDFSQLFDNELTQELSHKTVLITQQLTDEFVIPFIELFTDEFQDLFQELAKNFQPIKLLIERLQQFIPNFEKLRENLIPLKNNISYQMKSLLRNTRKQCKYSETCYKMVYALENYGSQAFFELLLNKMQEIGLKTHRLVITTSGQLIRSLPSIPIPEFVKQYFEEYSQEFREGFETIINSNQDLKSFVNHFKQISEELFQENVDSINWSRVRQSFNEIMDIILSRSSLSNSTRVLIWDLKRGEIQVEMKTPLIHSRRLRAVMNSLNETTIKQMNKDSKVKHIIDSLEQKMTSFKSMFY